MTQAAVALKGIGKTFSGASGQIKALEDVSLEVAPGEFVAIIGPSGCGKTTLLRVMAGLEEQYDGVAQVFGMDPITARSGRRYGMVFQDPVLLPWLDVEANVRLPLTIAGSTSREGGQRDPQELLELVGLAGFGRAHSWELSGGMRQRVAIARSLVLSPKLLLLDEPFGALDEITRQTMNLELLRIWSTLEAAAVLVTHSITEAVFLADRVVVMSARPGRVADVVTINLERPRSIEVLRRQALFEYVSALTATLFQASG